VPTGSINAPDTRKPPAHENAQPVAKECVRVTRYPIMSGSTKPPRLPSELIKPIDVAVRDRPL